MSGDPGAITFTELMAGLSGEGGGARLISPPEWGHERTAAGSVSAALCAVAAEHALGATMPLRSGHIAFAGPATGELVVCAEVVRRGRSSAVVEVRLDGEKGPAVRALLTYADRRSGGPEPSPDAAPDVPPPTRCEPFFQTWTGPPSASRFEFRNAGGAAPVTGDSRAEFLVWGRHRDPHAANLHPVAALLALADAPPPPVTALFRTAAPVATVTWSFDLHAARFCGGWSLLHTRAEEIAHGFASQIMAVWSTAGERLLSGRQTVVLI